MFERWRAQTEPIELDEHATNRFLNDSVRVFEQSKDATQTTAHSMRVHFTEQPVMTRRMFLRVWAVWFAATVLGTAIYLPNRLAPSDQAVATALGAIAALPSQDAFETAYLDYAFSPHTSDLGYYAKDTSPSSELVVSPHHQQPQAPNTSSP